MTSKSHLMAVIALLSMACSSSASPSAEPTVADGGAPDTGVDVGAAGFQPADHPSLPIIPKHDGPVLARAKVVSVTFAGYAFKDAVTAFGDHLVASNWLDGVCAEYGCGAERLATHVVVNEAPPPTANAAGIDAMLQRLTQSGTLPAPAGDLLYVLYFPRETTVNPNVGSKGCDTGAAFHSSTAIGGTRVAYAAVADCSWHFATKAMFPDLSPVETIEEAASHEVIEALTDPFYPASPAFLLDDIDDPWSTMGGEVADWCVGLTTREAGFALTRVWSNARAARNEDPCAPAPEGVPYYNAAPLASKLVRVRAGDELGIEVRGWSSAAMPPWSLRVLAPPPMPGGFDAKPVMSARAIGNDETLTLTVSAPPTASSGARAAFFLASSRPGDAWFHQWPVLVEVQ